jgi:high affinity Mn2+ porin
MNAGSHFKAVSCGALLACMPSRGFAADVPTNSLAAPELQSGGEASEQTWNWHFQNTDIVQWAPAFPAKYSGPNSFLNSGQVAETVSVDLYAGVRLWRGAEAHADLLVWQGFGLS